MPTLERWFADVGPLHILSNPALVVRGLAGHTDDYSAAIGDAVTAVWQPDRNATTVGGLWACPGGRSPTKGRSPEPVARAGHQSRSPEPVARAGREEATPAGVGELRVDELVDRILTVADAVAVG